MNGSKTVNLQNIFMRTVAVLLLLVLLSTCVVSGRFARYSVESTDTATARVADYVFDVNDTVNAYIDISGIVKPGDDATYTFSVTNVDSNGVSEVTEEYQILMELRGDLPLVCELTPADTTDSQLSADGKSITAAQPVQSVGGVKTYTFHAASAGANSYTLTVSWPGTENDIKYSRGGLAELTLTVSAQQVD